MMRTKQILFFTKTDHSVITLDIDIVSDVNSGPPFRKFNKIPLDDHKSYTELIKKKDFDLARRDQL